MEFSTDLIAFKRGLSVNLPSTAEAGEPLYTLDTKKLYIGNGAGKPLTMINANVVSGGSTGGTTVPSTSTGSSNIMEMTADEQIHAGDPCIFTATGTKPASLYYTHYVSRDSSSDNYMACSADAQDPGIYANVLRVRDCDAQVVYTATTYTSAMVYRIQDIGGYSVSAKGFLSLGMMCETVRFYAIKGPLVVRMSRSTNTASNPTYYMSLANVLRTNTNATSINLTPVLNATKDTDSQKSFYSTVEINGYNACAGIFKYATNVWRIGVGTFDPDAQVEKPPFTLNTIVDLPTDHVGYDVQAAFRTEEKGLILLYLRNVANPSLERFVPVYWDGTSVTFPPYTDFQQFQNGALWENNEQRMHKCEDGSYMIFVAGVRVGEYDNKAMLLNITIDPTTHVVSLGETTTLGVSSFFTSANLGDPMWVFFRSTGLVICHYAAYNTDSKRYVTTVVDIRNKKPIISKSPLSGTVVERDLYSPPPTTTLNVANANNLHDQPTFVDKNGNIFYNHLISHQNSSKTFFASRLVEVKTKTKIEENTDLVAYALNDANPGETVKLLVPTYTIS